MDLLKKLFKGDRIVWIIFMLFCLISIIEVFSASSTLTFKSGDHWSPYDTYHGRYHHCIFYTPDAMQMV